VLNNISTSVATAAGVDPGNVIVTASAASTRIDIIITTPSATASSNIEENMAATMFSDASAASSVLGLTVTSAPTITSQTVLTIIPPAMSAGLPVPDAGRGTMLTVQIAVGAGSLLGGIAAILLVIRCRRSRAKSVGPTGNTHRAFGRSRAQVGSGASTSSRTADERGVATHGIALEEDFDIVKAARPVRQTGAAVRPARDREAEATIDLKKDKDLEAEATIDFVKKNKPVAPAFASIASALDSSSSAASIAPPALPPASVAGGSEGGEGDCLGGGGEGGGGGGECGGGEGGRGCGNGGGGEGEGGGGDSINRAPLAPTYSSAADPDPVPALALRYAIGSSVFVKHSHGAETLAYVKEYDAERALYTVEIETLGSGQTEKCHYKDLRAANVGLIEGLIGSARAALLTFQADNSRHHA
jgi:hypothetical protein